MASRTSETDLDFDNEIGDEDFKEEDEEEEVEEEEEEELPALTKQERRELFDTFKTARNDIEELESALEEMRKKYHETLGEIFERAGRGPYKSGNSHFVIVKRKPNKKRSALYLTREINFDSVEEI